MLLKRWQEQRRPVLAPSRLEDPRQKIMFLGGHWVNASGGHAAVEHTDGIVYLAVSLRNVGSGIAVCHGWIVRLGERSPLDFPIHAPLETFRLQSRDLYVPAGDIGMWQGALRNPDDPVRAGLVDAIDMGSRSGRASLFRSGRSPADGHPIPLGPDERRLLTSLKPAPLSRFGWPAPRELDPSGGEAIYRDHQVAAERRAATQTESAVSALTSPVAGLVMRDAVSGICLHRASRQRV